MAKTVMFWATSATGRSKAWDSAGSMASVMRMEAMLAKPARASSRITRVFVGGMSRPGSGHGDGGLVLDRAQHEVGVDLGDAWQGEELLVEEAVVGGHVLDHHPQHEVGVAGGGVALQHLRVPGDPLLEVGGAVEAVATQGDHHQGAERLADPGRVHQGGEALDHAAGLQRLDPSPAGRGGEADLFGELLVGDAAVALERLQDAAVVAIELVVLRSEERRVGKEWRSRWSAVDGK